MKKGENCQNDEKKTLSIYEGCTNYLINMSSNIDSILTKILAILIPLKGVAAKDTGAYTSPFKHSNSHNLILEQLNGQEIFDRLEIYEEPINKAQAYDPELLENSLKKAGNDQIDIFNEDGDSKYHILWSYYHDSNHIFKTT